MQFCEQEKNTLSHPNEPTMFSTSYRTRTFIHIYKNTERELFRLENSEKTTKNTACKIASFVVLKICTQKTRFLH